MAPIGTPAGQTLAGNATERHSSLSGTPSNQKQQLAGPGVDTVRHESRDRARRVIFAGVAGALQVVQDLLVDVAEMLALGEVVEIDLVDPVDDLPRRGP